jgi:hypothetical protein
VPVSVSVSCRLEVVSCQWAVPVSCLISRKWSVGQARKVFRNLRVSLESRIQISSD